MPRILSGKRIVVGVTGGIAAYKVVELVRRLVRMGAVVDVVMTRAATDFVGPLTFQALTRRPVQVTTIGVWEGEQAGHVTVGASADLMVIAPATADVLAKLAHGLADDAVTLTALACPSPLLVAPAMDHHMFRHPATQENLAVLRARGVVIVGPGFGPLASGLVGEGRMVEPDELLGAIRTVLGQRGTLAGRRVVVTAGPTREPLDPVRFLSNHSSGKMGYALAEVARDRGAQTTLVTGPTCLAVPYGVSTVAVETAAEMLDAVAEATRSADVLVMCAAVADFRPRTVAPEKLKKRDGPLLLELEPTVDILATVHRRGLLKVGFAAETERFVEHAREKLTRKGLDLLVLNDARRTMGADSAQVTLLRPGRPPERLPELPKEEVAELIWDAVEALVKERLST
ncbi:MAG: bifunctional phosphopantothenoylcysteine decarboxylase/phosphopantothenate--cysteine ligase CoaBC [Thermomicrobium sp.]|nr:bifunctional phosphopantothenoylcysteine decarboxylase/phosphopantothenate--cysteine ligase CoaBC [Thermomicrobium sp.]MCS7246215.1 bifunctional phosphopantothenoylcysteine decarboxylase/phosphopantothenate--cysteine ligase CoaBC [Thermomicrobium sp.]MDW7982345.1 bifunctional phosphopantothenoylcysteine decarboxylase/phosphopantothenate--cysteine ligase CoaBC [Thermomicrobium sp.]